MNDFAPKIDIKKVKEADEGSAFKVIADAYREWMNGLEKFHDLTPAQQNEYIIGFGKDVNDLLIILREYQAYRTDDCDDRGNQI